MFYLTERDYRHPDDFQTFHTRYFIPKLANINRNLMVTVGRVQSLNYDLCSEWIRIENIHNRINFSIGKQNGTWLCSFGKK
jgi:hypothetical protein